MILFVFEGAEREPRIFKTIKRLFFGEGEIIICSFGNNIYELYRQLQELDGDGERIAVLCGFPLFLFEYFKSDIFDKDVI